MQNPTKTKSDNWIRRFLVGSFLALVACAGLAGIAYYYRAPILTGLANAWIVDEPITEVDAVAVLGGGLQYRTFEAARLFKAGKAKEVLVTDTRPSPTDDLGLTTSEKELMRQVLLKEGVPAEKIHFVGSKTTSSYEDVAGVFAWSRTNHLKTITLPTDIFHTRRLRWLASRLSNGHGLDVRIIAIQPREYHSTNWWQREEGLISFQNEVIKSLFYLVKYGGSGGER